jgi:ribonuclease BN (tRNA processing enzyme)
MATMKLIFLGSGSAFTTNSSNYHSNMLVVDEQNNTKLLIDCGSDARHSLGELGYSHRDIDNVYISHLHADHAGGMEWLALTTMFDTSCSKPTLYGVAAILDTIWSHTLRGGLSTIQGIKADLPLFFNLVPADIHGTFVWNNVTFQTVQTIHIVNNFGFMPSYSLLFTLNNTKIFITTDSQSAPTQMKDFYNRSDIIFHDCETCCVPSGVHAHFTELSQLPPEIKAKMWLYHYNPGELPDAVNAGFRGFVKKGQTFEF